MKQINLEDISKMPQIIFLTYYLSLLYLLPAAGYAGEINQISYNDAILTIQHRACQLGSPTQEPRKLIIPLSNCAHTAGQIDISNHNLKEVHWAQHDPNTVWVVANFAAAFQYELETSQDQYLLCLPVCHKPEEKNLSALSASTPTSTPNLMFSLERIPFTIPLEGILIDEFLDRSIGFRPPDVIRDGLPDFGAIRDDWQGLPRKHEGYDIYVNQINVIAAADGIVTSVRVTPRAGLYVKIQHGYNLSTLYVHLQNISVRPAQKVKQGDIIGRIDGPAGNAISPQLHFELKIRDTSVDPLPYIENFYRDDPRITEKINHYQKLLVKNTQLRASQVRDFLTSRPVITRHTPDDNAESKPESLLYQAAVPNN
jgi:hypothetical protein